MAIIFELWAECENLEDTQQLAEHFKGLKHTLLSGRTITWSIEITQPPLDPVAMLVWSPDLSRFHIKNLQDALETTEAGLHLYAHLRVAPAFCFARVAWEAECIPMGELQEYLDGQGGNKRFLNLECVINDDLYKKLGSPKFYRRFRNGYWWNPYRGESYQPLGSSDQNELNKLRRQLLPECTHS